MSNHNKEEVLRFVEDGVEYFTIVATGESGMSQRGLARSCGKDEKQIRRLLADLRTNNAPKRLKCYESKDLTLTHGYRKKGGNTIIYKADFCSDVITHYAFLGSESAQDIVAATNKIGLTSFIQGKTKWLPQEYQSSTESRKLLDLLILSEPQKRSIHFDEKWQKEACRVTQYAWEGMPMAKFIRQAVYDTFPDCLIERLEDVNPYVDNKRRANKHYQHFDKDLDENVLKQHIRDVLSILKMSGCLTHFWRLMQNRFGDDGIQLELDL